MHLRFSSCVLPCLASAIVTVSVAARAAQPGVPALPATPFDYVGYAVANLPDHFAAGPVANLDNTPDNNPGAPAYNPITNAGAALGRVLFYDERLSHNDGTSCASCHQQQTGFSDPNQKSIGFEGGLTNRHSMALSNSKFYANGAFFWDERAATLETQVLMPIQDPVEMGSNLTQLTAELSATAFYPALFQNAFGSPEVTSDRMAKALAQFVRSMVSYNSKYDDAVEAGTPAAPDFSGYNAQELLGKDIFHGAGACSQCHITHAQVGDQARNIGLDATNADAGVSNGRFKTPSLRNVEVRAGFMHDGRFTTLEEVVDFYSTGIQFSNYLDGRLKNGAQAKRFNFTQEEKDALVAFLKTLTDEEFLTSDLFSDPFVALDGDVNDDGVVDADDLAAWRNNFAAGAAGDGDGDGDADGSDLLAWQRNLGKSWQDFAIPPAAVAIAAVPEPSAALLLLISSTALAAFHRRRRN